ncbi:ABC transporter substrate-binding protein [Microbacterium sp. A588]
MRMPTHDARRRGIAGIAATAAAMLLLTSCSGGEAPEAMPVADGWDAVIAAAEQEGSVMLYSNMDPAVLDQIQVLFNEKYPNVTMEYSFGLTSAVQPKIEAEAQTGNGVGDVLVQSDPIWVGNNPDYFVEAVGPSFDNPDYDREAYFSDGVSFGVANSIVGFAWNTDQIPEGLTDYDDLIDPKLQGRIGVMRPTGAVVSDYYKFLQDTYGEDYLEKLGELGARIYPTSIAISQAIASGEIWATPYSQPLQAQKAAGAPIDWSTANNAWGGQYTGQVLASAPNPNAAQLLADFLVSPEAQAEIVMFALPVLPGIPDVAADPEEIQLGDASAWTPAEVEEYIKRWDGWFS